MPQIEVTFDIDANGIVNVSAKDKATGKEQAIRIQASGGLTEADIQRMVKEAQEHAEEDKKRRAAVEARNQADSLLYSTEKALREHGDKVPAGDRQPIELAVAELKGVLDSEDADAIKAKTDALAQVSMKLGEAMYRAQQDGARERGRRRRPGAVPAAAGRVPPAARAWSTPSSRKSTTPAASGPPERPSRLAGPLADTT
jgi:molecular chaperone DnaK